MLASSYFLDSIIDILVQESEIQNIKYFLALVKLQNLILLKRYVSMSFFGADDASELTTGVMLDKTLALFLVRISRGSNASVKAVVGLARVAQLPIGGRVRPPPTPI